MKKFAAFLCAAVSAAMLLSSAALAAAPATSISGGIDWLWIMVALLAVVFIVFFIPKK